jgi:hypothetical protein
MPTKVTINNNEIKSPLARFLVTLIVFTLFVVVFVFVFFLIFPFIWFVILTILLLMTTLIVSVSKLIGAYGIVIMDKRRLEDK